MKKVLFAVAVASASLAVQAATIDDLHNTGAGLTKGQVDTHYAVEQGSAEPANAYATDTTSPYPANNSWLINNIVSAWDSPAADPGKNFAVDLFHWDTTFDLSGFNPATASFSGRFTADDSAVAYLNGYMIGTSNSYSAWSGFNSQPGFFKSGVNKLDFHVMNSGAGPTGLRVEFTNTYKQLMPDGGPSGVSAIPEPETYALMLAGLASLGFIARRRIAA